MRIVYTAAEAAPFAKSGGLGDVAGALPAELLKTRDTEVCVFLPYYKSIKQSTAFDISFVCHFEVRIAWRMQYVGLFKAVIKNRGVGKNKRNDLVYYFIDNEYYFGRDGYGYMDDGERFAYFSKAVLETLCHIDYIPDVIHCNDWQTGFLPLFLRATYSERLQNVKTVFTIHNIEYQGKADPPFLSEVLGVSEEWHNAVMFDNLVNAMKTGIVLADKVTTVSDTYAFELRHAYFACGLESVISDNAYKLCGVLNGVDTKKYDPAADAALFALYRTADLSGKAADKKFLQEKLGLAVDPDVPMVAIISRLVAHKGMELVEYVAEELLQTGIQLVVLGTGDRRFEDLFKFLAYQHQGRVSANICFDQQLASEIYAGADLFLMPSKSEPCGLSQLIAMRYGTIPIVRETGGLVDTVPPLNVETLTGRGFTFKGYNAHDMLGAVRRAVEFYHDKPKRMQLIRQLMRVDSGWKNSAQKYMCIYQELTGNEE